jgi:hypothetical protein
MDPSGVVFRREDQRVQLRAFCQDMKGALELCDQNAQLHF